MSRSLASARFSWQQTMLRIKNPQKSLKFYRDTLGMTHIDTYHFNQWGFSLYFLESLPLTETYNLTPGSPEAHRYLWSMQGVSLELTHNHDSTEEYSAGNGEGEGFGHLAFSCEDVYKSCDGLLKDGHEFKKKPDEGRMKGLAFVYDPDGYWVEIVRRQPESGPEKLIPEFSFAQTMLRIKDPKKSIEFYTKKMGMVLLRTIHHNDFSLFFLASIHDDMNLPPLPDPENADEAGAYIREHIYTRCIPVLELTHNHGTEEKDDFKYENGNNSGKRGFGHIGFLCDDVYESCASLEEDNVQFQKKPDEGGMKDLAFGLDPDGYWLEIIKRGQEGNF